MRVGSGLYAFRNSTLYESKWPSIRPDRFNPLRRALVMTEMVRKVIKPAPVWNRSPEVQALSITELFGYKPDYSHFDIKPGQVSLFLLRVRWQFWCLKTVRDTAVLTVRLVFWGVRSCTDVLKASSVFIFRVNFLDCLFLRMKACYFETSVTNYERARCSVQKRLVSCD